MLSVDNIIIGHYYEFYEEGGGDTERGRRKAVTMSDVASKAGVSITTVSHVLNRTAPISKETADKVMEAVSQTRYNPPVRLASKLKGESRTIGIFVPDISNEFYSRFVQAIYNASWDNGYTALMCGTRHDRQVGSRYIKELIRGGVAGFIVIGSSIEEKHVIAASERVPVVLGDYHLLNFPVSSVITDNGGAMRQLVRRLKNAGYRRIGYISQDLHMSNVQDRYMGFKMGLEENDLPSYEKEIICSEFLRFEKIATSYQLFKAKLAKKAQLAEVYACSSDLIAVGVLAALAEAGYSVPRDVGVVGFDDITLAAYTRPALTTVAQNIEQLGKSCFDMLLRKLNSENEPVQQIVIGSRLIARDSVRL